MGIDRQGIGCSYFLQDTVTPVIKGCGRRQGIGIRVRLAPGIYTYPDGRGMVYDHHACHISPRLLRLALTNFKRILPAHRTDWIFYKEKVQIFPVAAAGYGEDVILNSEL